MKKLQLIAIALIAFIMIASCSDSSSPSEEPNVKIIGEIGTHYVTMINKNIDNDQLQSNEVDSIKIIRVRILMSRMMLFLKNDNSTLGEVIKTEPFVYDISLTGGESVLGSGDVPEGQYQKIKMEIHKFNSSEILQYSNDGTFMDFATIERNTILIEGITYLNGNPSTFTFKSDAVANLTLELEPALELKNGSNTTIAVKIDPNFFFKKWESILDPNDINNKNDIESAIVNTIKAMKK